MKKEVEVTGAIKIAEKLDIIELLVRQVSALVATTVVELSSNTFAIEAWLYRNLEVNCRQKANLAEEAAFGSKPWAAPALKREAEEDWGR